MGIMIITEIRYNWHQSSDGSSSGDDYSVYKLGENGVTCISKIRDCFQVEINEGKEVIRIYNPNMVFEKYPEISKQ